MVALLRGRRCGTGPAHDSRDMAVILFYPRNGRHLEDVVGAGDLVQQQLRDGRAGHRAGLSARRLARCYTNTEHQASLYKPTGQQLMMWQGPILPPEYLGKPGPGRPHVRGRWFLGPVGPRYRDWGRRP